MFQKASPGCLIIFLVGIISSNKVDGFEQSKSFCQPISSTTCSFSSSTGYGSTFFPNDEYRTQDEARKDLETLNPLIRVACHKDTQLFFCSHYIPLCIEDLKIVLKPCRNLCEEVKSGCSGVMERFGYNWPFNCSALPEKGSACVSGQSQATTTTPATTVSVAETSNNTFPATTKRTKPNKGKRKRGTRTSTIPLRV